MSVEQVSLEARLQVLEITAAALIAQLPQPAREEVVGLLTYVMGVSEETAQVTDSEAAMRCVFLRQWTKELIGRVVTSRKTGRTTIRADDDPAGLRYSNAPNQADGRL